MAVYAAAHRSNRFSGEPPSGPMGVVALVCKWQQRSAGSKATGVPQGSGSGVAAWYTAAAAVAAAARQDRMISSVLRGRHNFCGCLDG